MDTFYVLFGTFSLMVFIALSVLVFQFVKACKYDHEVEKLLAEAMLRDFRIRNFPPQPPTFKDDK